MVILHRDAGGLSYCIETGRALLLRLLGRRDILVPMTLLHRDREGSPTGTQEVSPTGRWQAREALLYSWEFYRNTEHFGQQTFGFTARLIGEV